MGELLVTQEGFDERKAKTLCECLSDVQKYGMANLPLASKLKFARAMMKYKLSYEDGVALYGKYIGNWGGASTQWRFDAVKDGEVVKSVIKTPNTKLHIEAAVSSKTLFEGDVYDAAAVRIRIADEYGNTAVYAQLPVELEVHGAIDLIGPKVVTAEGGMCGCYVKTGGEEGRGKLVLRTAQTEPVEISFSVIQR